VGSAFAAKVFAMKAIKFSIASENDAYIVEVFVPTGAWTYLDEMHEFHMRNGIQERYRWQRTEAGDILYWRFSEPAYAEFFIAEFGGELVPSPATR
jgi:hypothetical protein